ncbi:hypothetical protein IFM89_003972 [Coptis chinensis]|uniref:PHD finger transcription factor n=1 Tax=Coptis chinensis TaxID=261450 RepID=A0A835H348_9MAGN|nr:hypothetical protein IFM89_003972 [Coptis chinensis]
MAALLQPCPENRKKRKRKEDTLIEKFPIDDTVEVRSDEDGFQGSWHAAVITKCDGLVREVRYKFINKDEVSGEPLIETVNYVGRIRHVPPTSVISHWSLHYGLCVDAFYNDAWWEGVVLDHDNGLDERLVFFPDMGDVETIKFENLRVTLDWDEVIEEWKLRGDWLFLELVEKYEEEWFSTVSVRQLWYELSAKDAFKTSVKQWTRFVSTMWDDLVREVISEHYFLAAECQLAVFESEVTAKFIKGPSKRTRSKSIATSEAATPPCKVNLQYPIEEDQPVLASLETSLKCREDSSILCYERKRTTRSSEVKLGGQVDEDLRFYSNYDPNCFALSNVEDLGLSEDILVKNCDFDPNSVNLMDFGDDPICVSACSGPSPFAQFSSSTAVDKEDLEDGMEGIKYNQEGTLFHDSKKWSWVRVKPTRFTPISEGCHSISDRDTWIMKLSGAEDYPDAVVDYLRIRQEKSCSGKRFKLQDTGDRARIHLCHLGWTVKRIRDPTVSFRVHYISPKGRTFHSLVQVCLHLTTTKESDWNIPEKKGALADAHSLMVVEQGYNPEAVMELCCGGELSASDLKVWGPKAVTSLIAMGWKYCCSIEQGEIYTSPHGKEFRSLQKACKELCMEGLSRLTKPTHRNVLGEKSKGLLTPGNYALATVCTEVEEDVLLLPNWLSAKNCTEISGLSQSRECEFDYMELRGVRATRKSRKDSSYPSTSSSLQSNRSPTSSDTSQDRMYLAPSYSKPPVRALNHNPSPRELKKRKMVRALPRKGDNLDGSCPSRVLRSHKRARQVVASNPSYCTPRTVLSWLIDSNLVLPRAKVSYRSAKDQVHKTEGKITRDGIKCNCCQRVYGISGFGVHAGSNYHRPAANIILEDGRSLLEISQMQIVQDSELKSFTSEPYQRIKSNPPPVKSDSICSVCHYGGTLLLCDQCPSAFHLSCINLESLPKGKWFCPSCRCSICFQSEFDGNICQFTEKTVLYCDQCEQEYHVGCLREARMMKLNSCPKGNWFCCKECEKIFMGLRKLLGRPISVDVDGLSWTILKYSKNDYDRDKFDAATMIEHYSKLNVALAVMHECFEPIKEPKTKDIVKDVLFNKRSALKRLSFRGFYTILLEKEEELVSVATVRVYGRKVAEVPLVGTRVQFRRQGMCRILMNMLEKKLTEFGVERLLLPAIPQVLHAWTTSFGFSQMTNSERLKFLQYTFLDFQDTTMCQKILKMVATIKIKGPKRAYPHGCGSELNLYNGVIPFDRGNTEVAQQNDRSDKLELVPVEVSTGDEGSQVEMVSPVIMSMQATDSNSKESHHDIGTSNCALSIGNADKKEDKAHDTKFFPKYYSRRRYRRPGL